MLHASPSSPFLVLSSRVSSLSVREYLERWLHHRRIDFVSV